MGEQETLFASHHLMNYANYGNAMQEMHQCVCVCGWVWFWGCFLVCNDTYLLPFASHIYINIKWIMHDNKGMERECRSASRIHHAPTKTSRLLHISIGLKTTGQVRRLKRSTGKPNRTKALNGSTQTELMKWSPQAEQLTNLNNFYA